MDADDTISDENGRQLRALADQPKDNAPMAYVMQVRCPARRRDCASDVTVVDHVKMFRNLPGMSFEGRIHEQILPAIRQRNGRIAWTDIFVEHSGSDQSRQGQAAKQLRDLRLLELEMTEKPDHPFVLFNLGMTYDDREDYAKAVAALRRCIDVSDPKESHVRKAYAILVNSLTALGDLTAAWQVCHRGQLSYPKDPELLFRKGVLAHRLGRLEEAVESYEEVLRGRTERQFASIDMGITGWKARNNLAAVYADLGRQDLAELQWRYLVAEEPHNRKGWQGLANSLISQKKFTTAEVEIDRMTADENIHCEAMILRARVAEARGDAASARSAYDAAICRFRDDAELLCCACQFYFQQGQFEAAIAGLTRLCTQEPEDGAALHNLGTVYATAGRWKDAVECYRKSLAVRPQAPNTQQHLADALDQLRKQTPAAPEEDVERKGAEHDRKPSGAS